MVTACATCPTILLRSFYPTRWRWEWKSAGQRLFRELRRARQIGTWEAIREFSIPCCLPSRLPRWQIQPARRLPLSRAQVRVDRASEEAVGLREAGFQAAALVAAAAARFS